MRHAVDARRKRRPVMPRGPKREIWCHVVSEPVVVTLRREGGLGRPLVTFGSRAFFVQCNQSECQYVELNRPPCPLHLGLFESEIEARKRRDGVLE